ncbi:MAG: hypothetical protein RMI56_06970 [Sulfolobales archaeon]|nr:hypothetical protein [Sulfolobales archaeon]MDW8083514.1 hypothetical protein [Sulfolobales archaeon]
MKVPLVTRVVRLSEVLRELGAVEKVELAGSTSGKPVLKISSGNSIYIYTLTEEPRRVVSFSTSSKALKIGDISIERENREVMLSFGGRVFRGIGFIDIYGTSIYVAACSRSKCVTGVLDLVDGLTKLYSLDMPELRLLDLRSTSISIGYGGFSISSKSVTISASVSSVEVLPGFFRYIASCASGDYLIDRDSFLVRVRKNSLDILGRVNEVISAACVSDGIAIADREGLKIVRYGAYTNVMREAIREVSSHRDIISIVSKSGLVKVLSRKNAYTLDSPALKSCKLTTEGLACLTEDSVIFLDPETLIDVVAEVHIDSESGLVELVAQPWFEQCHYLITPKIVAVLREEVVSGVLHAKLYPKVLGWEGYVRAIVECPTYSRSIEEFAKFGRIELDELTEKLVTIARFGRVFGSKNSNCVGRLKLRLRSRFPVQIPFEVRFEGVEDIDVKISSTFVDPGLSDFTIRFTGRCSENRGVYTKLVAASGLVEPEEIASVYIDPREFRVIDRSYHNDVEIVDSEYSTTIKALGGNLKLYCLNGERFEGGDSLLVKNCEEPALLEVVKTDAVDSELFEFSLSRILRGTVQKCFSEAVNERAVSGGFYADCSRYETTSNKDLDMKIEYSNNYKVATYLGGSKLSEAELDPVYMLTGISVDLGVGRVRLHWRELVELSTKTALAIGKYLRGVILEKYGS